MLDLCLIQLPNPALESPKMYFSLGNLYLAAVAQKAGYSVRLLDCRDGMKPLPKAWLYGFSCTTPEITKAKEIAKSIKGALTIVGGAHPSLLPEDCEGHFDYVVRGEGEDVLLKILKGKVKPGVVTAPRLKELDEIPYPAWDMVQEPFSRTLFTGERYGEGDVSMAVIASRGCPWSCRFCGNIYGVPVRFRSPKDIDGEIVELGKRGVKHLRFVDDNFTLHPQLKELCEVLWKRRVVYRCHTRSDLVTSEKAQLLAASGCEECSLGIESADESVLKLNHKKETVKHHKDAIRILKEAGLRVKGYWMSGLPGETDETIVANMAFMQETQLEKWTLSTFTPYPGCDIFANPADYGVEVTNHDWSTWWNFVFNVRGKTLEGRNGYNHVLIGQTQGQMKRRHDVFYQWLLSECWKKEAAYATL